MASKSNGIQKWSQITTCLASIFNEFFSKYIWRSSFPHQANRVIIFVIGWETADDNVPIGRIRRYCYPLFPITRFCWEKKIYRIWRRIKIFPACIVINILQCWFQLSFDGTPPRIPNSPSPENHQKHTHKKCIKFTPPPPRYVVSPKTPSLVFALNILIYRDIWIYSILFLTVPLFWSTLYTTIKSWTIIGEISGLVSLIDLSFEHAVSWYQHSLQVQKRFIDCNSSMNKPPRLSMEWSVNKYSEGSLSWFQKLEEKSWRKKLEGKSWSPSYSKKWSVKELHSYWEMHNNQWKTNFENWPCALGFHKFGTNN